MYNYCNNADLHATLDVFHLNDAGKLFWVITLLLDIDMSDFVVKDSPNTDRTSCMQLRGNACSCYIIYSATHTFYIPSNALKQEDNFS